jgi:acetylornithine/N-succinyldiaminopimelate aminotransferase
MGRTGELFAHQRTGVEPDIMALAKALGGGFPVGAFLTTKEAGKGMTPGTHGSTFGGNPLAMTAVRTTIDTMKEEGLLANAERIGATIRSGIADAVGTGAGITEIRGMGAMIGVELDRPCGELVREALAAGLVINVTADNVIRMLPPLVMSEAEARMVVERLAPLVKRFLEKRVAA